MLPEILAAFGINALPFPKAPALEGYFRWPALNECLARLRFAHALHGFALVTGEVGAGKTSLLRLFLRELDAERSPAVYLADSALSPREFYGRVLEHFGVVPAFTQSRARLQFQTLLSDLHHSQGKSPVIVIDEGHELSAAMVQELRYLQNIDCDGDNPFTLVICGQAELRALLRLKAFEAVAQRVSVRFHLTGLSPAESATYIQHALRQVGSDRPVFTEGALQLLHTHARGLLRRLGLLATHAMLDAALAKTPLVEEPSVRRAVADLEEA